MRACSFKILALAGLFVCGWPRPLAAQGPRADQGKVIARIIVEEGQVFLQTKSGKPIVVPGQLSLREGDVLTTSKDVKGRFELGGDKNLLLGRLRRYRVGRDGIQEPAGEGGWRYLTRAFEDTAPASTRLPWFGGGEGAAGLAGRPGLIAKARVAAGQAFHRPAGWPQEVPALPALSLASDDELRLSGGARAQIQLVGGGWLFLTGPALVAITPDTVRVDAGAAMAKALGGRTVVLGPYRIFAGARVFSFATAPGALTVKALTGILTIQVAGGKPIYLAPGRCVELASGHAPRIGPIAIKPEIAAWEDLFNPAGPRIPVPVKTAEDLVTEKIERAKPPADFKMKTRNPDGPGPERRSGPPDPRVDDPRPIAELPLRDRIKALDGARSRIFYIKKRDDREKSAELATFAERVATETPDEVSALKLFKLTRQQRRARSDLNSFRQSRELSFEERTYRKQPARDRKIADERERLFGLPLFVETRRLLPFAQGNRARLIAGADALTRDILIARATGASDARIAELSSRRTGLLEEADRETDGMKELIRLSMEPYR